MLLIYGICLTLCAVGAAMNSHRNDTRFLMAMVAPWLCWFLVLLQLNNRYLVFASGFSALLPAVGFGPTLLGIIVSIIGYAGISDYTGGPGNPMLARLFQSFEPHIAWLLLLIAAIYLYLAIAPRRRLWSQNLPALRRADE
jgi:hypothetical protein